jgi:hypothetical protein
MVATTHVRFLVGANPLAGETRVRGFSKPGEGFFFLMKTVGVVLPPPALVLNCHFAKFSRATSVVISRKQYISRMPFLENLCNRPLKRLFCSSTYISSLLIWSRFIVVPFYALDI